MAESDLRTEIHRLDILVFDIERDRDAWKARAERVERMSENVGLALAWLLSVIEAGRAMWEYERQRHENLLQWADALLMEAGVSVKRAKSEDCQSCGRPIAECVAGWAAPDAGGCAGKWPGRALLIDVLNDRDRLRREGRLARDLHIEYERVTSADRDRLRALLARARECVQYRHEWDCTGLGPLLAEIDEALR